MPRVKAELGELEAKIMEVLWALGPSTAESVRSSLDRELKDVTVRTVLKRLEAKGLITHVLANRTFVYSALESRQRVAARAVKRIVDWFCGGSMDDVLVGMVDAELLDKRQLDKLAKRIEQMKQAKGPRKA